MAGGADADGADAGVLLAAAGAIAGMGEGMLAWGALGTGGFAWLETGGGDIMGRTGAGKPAAFGEVPCGLSARIWL